MGCCGNDSRKKEENHSRTDCTCCKPGKANDKATDRDLVCGMTIQTKDSPRSEYNQKTYFFCGGRCKKSFDENPQGYAKN